MVHVVQNHDPLLALALLLRRRLRHAGGALVAIAARVDAAEGLKVGYQGGLRPRGRGVARRALALAAAAGGGELAEDG
jgi:hypothetical protein